MRLIALVCILAVGFGKFALAQEQLDLTRLKPETLSYSLECNLWPFKAGEAQFSTRKNGNGFTLNFSITTFWHVPLYKLDNLGKVELDSLGRIATVGRQYSDRSYWEIWLYNYKTGQICHQWQFGDGFVLPLDTIKMNSRPLDALSAFYLLRQSAVTVGDTMLTTIITSDSLKKKTFVSQAMTTVGKQELIKADKQYQRCYKIVIQLPPGSNLFPADMITVWASADSCLKPVRVETDTMIPILGIKTACHVTGKLKGD